MTEIVLPNDTNTRGTMFGGRLLSLMDKCAGISAMRHADNVCVTVAVDSVEFNSPIDLGDVVTLEARVNRAFRTSVEVEIEVFAENHLRQDRRRCNRAFFTFVAVDDDGHPTPIPPILPESEDEKKRYEHAAMRRELRLFLKGRIAMDETVYIKDELIAVISGRDL